MGVRHTQLGSAGVHHFGKGRLTAADILSHGHGSIIGAGNADGLEHIIQCHFLAGLQPYLAAAHMIGVLTDRHKIIQTDFAGLQRFKCKQQRHNLGDGGNRAAGIGVFLVQNRAGILIHQNSRRAGYVKIRRSCGGELRRRGGEPAQNGQRCQHQAEQQGHGTFIHG